MRNMSDLVADSPPTDPQDTLNTILERYRKGRDEAGRTVEILVGLHSKLTPEAKNWLRTALWSEVTSDFQKAVKGESVSHWIFPVAIPFWIRCDDTGTMTKALLGLLDPYDPNVARAWAVHFSGLLWDSLQRYRDRFSSAAVAEIETHFKELISAEQTGLDGYKLEPELARAASRLFEILDDERFEPIKENLLTASDPHQTTPEIIDKSPQSHPNFKFTKNASAVVRRAHQLAERSARGCITSSCLLFGFAEEGGPQTDACRFVRGVLDRSGSYAQGFARFLADSAGSRVGDAIEVDGLESKVSPNTLAILQYAESVAPRVSPGAHEIHARHLLAALLVAPLSGKSCGARVRLERREIKLSELLLQFRDYIRKYAGSDDAAQWDDVLGLPPGPQHSPSPFIAGPSGYNTEYCGLGSPAKIGDCLDVEAYAQRLAELLALRETRMPLAVGVFGNWGSGKTYFLNLIDRHIKKLAKQEPEDPAQRPRLQGGSVSPEPNGDGPWCRYIVPVYFNAWHYSDTNLWASLVTEVFDCLFAHLQPKTDELALVQLRLREANGVSARAEEEVRQAREAVRKATAGLQAAQTENEEARQAVRGLVDGLRALLPSLNTPENERHIEEWLGVSVEAATLSQLAVKTKELASLEGRISELWRRATAREGLAARLSWGCSALLILGLAWYVGEELPQLEPLLRHLGPSLRAVVAVVGGAVAWTGPVYKQVSDALSQLENWQGQAEAAQARLADDPQVIAANERLRHARTRAEEAEAVLGAARKREQELAQSLDELRPERRLARFIEARARSADYRGQLGLVGLARKDFQELSEIFADTEALRKKIREHPDQAEGLKKLGASIDRIMLFVDDLDRCQPDKVVDVLQAIHLLLAFPLFGVVVGVDQRCLKQSLRMRFEGLLTPPRRGASSDNHAHEGTPNVEEVAATPLDYLEKIFHIPFHLPAMDKDGFATLVEGLTEPIIPSVIWATTSTRGGTDLAGGADESKSPVAGGVPSAQTTLNIVRSETTSSKEAGDQVPSIVPEDASRGQTSVIGSVPLTRWERDALKEYHSLVGTPRGTTRLLNTYRLVRAGVPALEWDSFRGDQGGKCEFRLALLILAVAAGQPAVAREWFTYLGSLDKLELGLPKSSAVPDQLRWEKFISLYYETEKQLKVQLTKELLVKWINRVERFSF